MVDPVRVLHVDDDADFADLTSAFLERKDDRFIVETTTSVSDALELLADEEIDCVLSDYDMPGMDGIEFLQAVREDHPDLPFILFTGKGSETIASEAISAGVTDYLQKEGGSDQYTILANRIDNLVENYHTQSALERSEERYRRLVEQAPVPILIYSQDGIVIDANTAAVDFLDADTEAELLGKEIDDLTHPANRERIQDRHRQLVDRGQSVPPSQHKITTLEGEVKHVIVSSAPIRYDDDRAIQTIAYDITERVKREQQLERERNRFESLFEMLPEPATLVHSDDQGRTRIKRVNVAFEDVFGYDETDITGKRLDDLLVPADRKAEARQIGQKAVAGDLTPTEVRRQTADGELRDFLLFAAPFDDTEADGGTEAFVIYVDITEQRRQNHRLNALIDAFPDVAFVRDEDGRCVDVLTRPEDTDLFYTEPKEFIDSYLHDVFPDALADRFLATIQRTLETGEQQTIEYELDVPAGTRWFEGRTEPLPYEVDDKETVIWVSRDITDRKQRERELEETTALLSTLFETLPVGVLAEDADRTVMAANQQILDLLNMTETADDIIGTDCEKVATRISDIFTESDAFVSRINELVAEREPVTGDELTLTTGETLERSYRPITLPNGDGHLWVYRDITERKRRETALSTLHEKTQAFFETADQQAVAERAVETARSVLELPINTVWLYDETAEALRPVASTETAHELFDDIPTYSGGESLSWQVYETNEVRIYDELHAEQGRYNQETPIQSEIILPLGSYGVMNIGSTATRAFDDTDIVLAQILADIVEAALDRADREQELRTQRQSLQRQNERLEEVTSIISHDLRNPLNVAAGRLELAQEECSSEHLDTIADTIERSQTLIDDLLTFAREGKQVYDPEPLALTEVCNRSWQNVETAEATLHVDSDLRLRADRSRLEQLFENLFRNAIEHGGEEAIVTVGDLDDGFYVADDGPGIPVDKRTDVFESGYSTLADGTGFGLAIVEGIVENHGWTIEATESEDGGARFEITGVETV